MRLDEDADAELIDRLDTLAEDRDRSLNYLLCEAARETYLDSERSESMQSDAERIDAIEDRLAAVEDAVSIGNRELRDEVSRALPDDDRDELRERVESVDWDDVDVSRTDDRVAVLTDILVRLRDADGQRVTTADLLAIIDEAGGVDLAESTRQRMLSDVLGQVDDVEGGGRGSHGYRWRDDEDGSDA